MAERNELVRQIKAMAQELVGQDGLEFDVFRMAHLPEKGCQIDQETSLKTRIIEQGLSEGYMAKRLVCSKHNTSSGWVHIDY